MESFPTERPRRRLRRGTKFTLAGLATLLVLFVPSALAIHQYTDVPNSNPFHADIAAIAAAGITGGKTCVPPGTPPTYCPTEAITREAMAAFVRRGSGRISLETEILNATVNNTQGNHPIAEVDIVPGGVAGGTQLVHVQGVFTAYTSNGGCPCNFGIRLWDGNVGGTLIATQFEQFAVSGDNQRTFTIDAVVLAPSDVQKEYYLSVATDSAVNVNIYPSLSLTATTHPFGWNGTAVIDGSLPQGPTTGVTPTS